MHLLSFGHLTTSSSRDSFHFRFSCCFLKFETLLVAAARMCIPLNIQSRLCRSSWYMHQPTHKMGCFATQPSRRSMTRAGGAVSCAGRGPGRSGRSSAGTARKLGRHQHRRCLWPPRSFWLPQRPTCVRTNSTACRGGGVYLPLCLWVTRRVASVTHHCPPAYWGPAQGTNCASTPAAINNRVVLSASLWAVRCIVTKSSRGARRAKSKEQP